MKEKLIVSKGYLLLPALSSIPETSLEWLGKLFYHWKCCNGSPGTSEGKIDLIKDRIVKYLERNHSIFSRPRALMWLLPFLFQWPLEVTSL